MGIGSAVLEASKATDKPIILLLAMGGFRDFEAEIFAGTRLPVVTSVGVALEVASALIKYGQNLQRAKQGRALAQPEISVNVQGAKELLRTAGKAMTEYESKKILSCYGISITEEAIAKSPEEAATIANRIGYPVALKVVSPQILHKTDARAIKLNIRNETELKAAYQEVIANSKRYDPKAEIQGVLVQEMVQGGREMIVGVSHDPQFGPTIMFGLGGIFVEVMKDIALRVAPITRNDAEEMIKEIKGRNILGAFRDKPEADIDSIIDTLLKISKLCDDLRETVLEIDINPLMVFDKGKGVKVVDALVVLRK
jgi:acyl-CoA synthetase (NDP forming)